MFNMQTITVSLQILFNIFHATKMNGILNLIWPSLDMVI